MGVAAQALAEHKCAVDVALLLDQLIRTIVSHPDEVRIARATSQETTVFTVTVSESDVGKIIGKAGRTARSLRILLSAAGQTNKHRFILEIGESARDHARHVSSVRNLECQTDGGMLSCTTFACHESISP